jgi:hypothetical protein
VFFSPTGHEKKRLSTQKYEFYLNISLAYANINTGAGSHKLGRPTKDVQMKITRSYFLSSTALVLAGATFGCSGNYGGTPNSNFTGSYRSVYNIPSLSESGYFVYGIDQKGGLKGSLTDGTGKVMAVNATVKNNNTFNGEVVDGSSKYPVAGTLDAKGGNFRIVKNGSEQQADFTVGGTISTEGNSAYQGIYAGVYSIPGLTQSGLTSYTVDSKGNINGLIQRGSDAGSLIGTVSSSGAFKADARFKTGVQPLSGIIIKTGDGSSQGNFIATQDGVAYPATFSKSETAQAGQSSRYNGAYRGTYGFADNTESGTVSFTIDPSGVILGSFVQTNNKPAAEFKGNIQNDGGFAGNLSYSGNILPTRPILGKIASTLNPNSAGSKQSGDFTVTIDGNSKPGSLELTIDGPERNSKFSGSYGESNITPGLFIPRYAGSYTTGLDFTADVQGEFIGTLGGYLFKGTITNDGRIVGTWGGVKVNGNDVAITGKIAHQGIPVQVDGKVVDKPGIAGNFEFTQAGTVYIGTIAGVGGNQ